MADTTEPDTKRVKVGESAPVTTQRKLRIKKKVYPSIAQYPTVDFRALLEPEKEKIERDSLAVISMRGKGSGFSVQDDEGKDPLHVLIEAESEDHAHKAERMVRDVLNDPSKLPPPVQTQMVVRQSIFGSRTGIKPGDPLPSTSSRPQEFYKEVKVRDDVAGGIIGRNGETVKSMERETSTRIHINREPSAFDAGARIIVIRGPTQEAVDRCEQLVLEFARGRAAASASANRPSQVVASSAPISSRRDSASPPRSYSTSPPVGDAHSAANGNGRFQIPAAQQAGITEYYTIPNHRAGAVIGRGGVTVKTLQSKYHARVTVPPTADPSNPNMRTIVIVGDNPRVIDLIKKEIDEIVEGKANFVGGPNDVATPVKIPDDKAGLIIGKQGATIKSIQDRMGVRIQIPAFPEEGTIPPTRTASVIGRPDMVVLAIQEIEKIITGELYNAAGVAAAATSGGQTYGSSASTGTQQQPDYSKQWEEYYNQLNQLPADQRELAIKALQEHQRSMRY